MMKKILHTRAHAPRLSLMLRTAVVAAPVFLLAGLTGPRGVNPPAAQAAMLQAERDDAITGIIVQGVGEVTVTPDIARLTLGVQTQAKTAALAASDNATRTDAVIKAVRAAGVDAKDIQTNDYSVNPTYQFGGGGEQKLTGYQVTNTVRVTVRKIADVGKVVDGALAAGANTGGGIAFDLSDPDPVHDTALAKAMEAAARKAKVIAKAAGYNYIRVVTVSEASVPDFPRPMFAGAMIAKADAAPMTPIQAGEQKIAATVTVRYLPSEIKQGSIEVR